MEKVAHFVPFKTTENGRIGRKFSIFNWQFSIGNLLLLFILLGAGFLRLYRIQDYMTFLGDEGRDALVVKEIIEGVASLLSLDIAGVQEKLTLLGPTASVGGFFLGPIYYYFMAPFLWLFNYNPVGPAVMVGLFGIATVFLVYKIGREFFNRGVGLIAAFLYSISPLVIAHSRSSWNPNLMPFFSLLTLYILYKAVVDNKVKLLVLCGFLLGITMQLHYLAIFLGVIVGGYLLIARIYASKIYYSSSEGAKRLSREVNFKIVTQVLKNYSYILTGFIVGWSPFLAFEIRHGFPNIQSIISFVVNPSEPTVKKDFLGIVYDVFFRLFGRLLTNFPPPEQVAIGVHQNVTIWYWFTLLLGIISVFLLLQRFMVSLNNKEQFRKMSLLVLWLVIGIGLFGFYKKPIYDYYFGFMFPLPFMLVGLAISSLYTNLHELTPIRPIGKILALAIFIGLAWINIKGMPFLFPANRQLAQVEEIARFVIEKTEYKPFNFALISAGNSDHAYRYFFTLWNKSPVVILNPQKDPQRKTVTDQLLIVCETLPCFPLGNSLWEVAGFGMAEIEEDWDVSVVKVFKLMHYKVK